MNREMQKGIQAYHSGNMKKAKRHLQSVIKKKPKQAEALHYLALISHSNKSMPQAEKYFQRALKHRPQDALILNNYANALKDLSRFDQALDSYRQALTSDPNNPDIHFNIAQTYEDNGLFSEAIEHYNQALELAPDRQNIRICRDRLQEITGRRNSGPLHEPGQAECASGTILQVHALIREHENEQAEELLRTLHRQHPRETALVCDLLLVLIRQEKSDDIQDILLQSINTSGDFFSEILNYFTGENQQHILDAFENIAGNISDPTKLVACLDTMMKFRKFEAIDRITTSLVESEDVHAAAFYNLRGNNFYKQNMYSEAMRDYQAAAEYNIILDTIYGNMAVAYMDMCLHDQADTYYRKALEIAPHKPALRSNHILGIHYNTAYTQEAIYHELLEWNKQIIASKHRQHHIQRRQNIQGRLRVGFISGSFLRHPVGYLAVGGMAHLPRDRFEVFCYAGNSIQDDKTREFQEAADHWIDIQGLQTEEIASLIRAEGIDILIDLSGHAEGSFLPVLACRAAPVQIKWVGGQFNSTGMSSVDYFLSDWASTPAGEEKWYTEEVVRMPNAYITYSPPAYAPNVSLLPTLRNGYITFGCFNNMAKVNNQVIDTWSELLHVVPRSKIILKYRQLNDQELADMFLARFKHNSISAQRVELRGSSPHSELLRQYNDIDIALDPFPYSGGVTTCEALWMGVPVITLPGKTFAGRHAATHLTTAGLGDWVVDSKEEYIQKALDLSRSLGGLTKLRSQLRDQVRNSPLCDHQRFGEDLGQLLGSLWGQ